MEKILCSLAQQQERWNGGRDAGVRPWVGGYLLPFSLHLVYLNKAM